jgi:F-type H+-transporting ATPase subunit gamma
MPSLKAIRKRIASVKSTQKITRAMKMVAAARLRRAQQRISELRLYALRLGEIVHHIATRLDREQDVPELLTVRPEKSILLVVIGSERGLAGAFNANIHRAAERKIREWQSEGKSVSIVTIGKKPREYFRRRKADIVQEVAGLSEKTELLNANEVASMLIDHYLAVPSVHDAVYVIFNEFKSAISQKTTIERLFPVQPEQLPHGSTTFDYIYEPTKKELLESIVPMYAQITIYRQMLESVASEFGARMTAMGAATDNAKELISKLTLDYNRARQASITKELMEIIGGAEALK